jgi:hypothetical protein
MATTMSAESAAIPKSFALPVGFGAASHVRTTPGVRRIDRHPAW